MDILDHLLEEAKYSVAIAKDNRVRFVVDKMDLCKDRQAAAHLALGLHPATMGGAEWEQIIANVLASAPLCIFTCTILEEANAIVKICEPRGYSTKLERIPEPLVVLPGNDPRKLFNFLVVAEQQPA